MRKPAVGNPHARFDERCWVTQPGREVRHWHHLRGTAHEYAKLHLAATTKSRSAPPKPGDAPQQVHSPVSCGYGSLIADPAQTPEALVNYLLLTSAPDRFELPTSPSGYWLILSFELTLRTETGEVALVLTHPSYAPRGPAEFRPGVLCPPFVAFPLHSGERYLRSAKDIRDLFTRGEGSIDIDQAIRTHLYLLGLTHYTVTPVGEILEYKESFREPGKSKCYKVLRFSIETDSTPDLVNLTDPLVLSRFIFLPLTDGKLDTFLTSVSQPNYGISREFRNAPLASNLCQILEDPFELAKLIDRSIEVENSSLYQEYEGYLVKCDIAGSGRLSNWLLRDATPFIMSNRDLEFGHEVNMHAFFLRVLTATGFPHVYPLGDGFLAGRPLEPASEPSLGPDLRELCLQLDAYCSRMVQAAKGALQLDYRLAVLATRYSYGRFTLVNHSCYFMTPAAITVTRIEDGLKKAQQDEVVPADARVLIEKDTADSLAPELNGYLNMRRSGVTIESKETTVECNAFSVLA